ncbi:DUF6799 domain-containing protein [Hymenobacter sp. BT730]|uniref:DUF6799 domain-containing protein n=1 Tax=Hymenobacter sp. BT730 TaxID=3063332 RepID=UPI0026E0BC25|nr:DUF6799 domain-containing protein [Hymenobacter sp. BT730]
MKRFFPTLLVSFALLAPLGAAAQAKTTPQTKQTVSGNAQYIMQNGTVVLRQGNQTTGLTQNIRLANGTKINYKSGIVELPGGKMTTLREGDFVTAKGEIVFATPGSAAAARGEKAPADAQFDRYVEKGAAISPETFDARLTSLNTRMDLMAQKIQLLNQKISLLSANAQRPTDTSQLDQQIQALEEQLKNIK